MVCTVADRPVQGLDAISGVAMTAAVWAHVETIDANDFAVVFFIFNPSDEPPSGFSRFSSSFARPGRVLSTEPSTTLMATPQPGVQLSTCPMAVGMVRTALAVPLSRTRRWPLTEHGRLQHTIRAKTTWTSHSHVQVRNFLAGRGCRDSTLQVSLSGYFSFSQMKMVFRAVLRPIQLAISPSITSS